MAHQILGPLLGAMNGDAELPDEPVLPPEVLEAFDTATDFYDDALIQVMAMRPSEDFGDEVAIELSLPPAMSDAYDHQFVRRLRWTFGEVIRKLAVDQTYLWSCVAEELVMHALVRRTVDWLVEVHDTGEEMSGAASASLIAFTLERSPEELGRYAGVMFDLLFEDLDFEHLFSHRPESIAAVRGELADDTGMAPLDLIRWFEPYNDERAVHPLSAGLVI